MQNGRIFKRKNISTSTHVRKDLLSDSIVYFLKKIIYIIMVMHLIFISISNRAFEFFKYVLESINPSMVYLLASGSGV